MGDQVHHPLDDVGRRVLAIAAVRAHGHLVGIDPVGGPGHVADPVDPRGAGGREHAHHGVGAAIAVGAQVGVVAHTQAAQGPIVPVGGLHVLDLPTAMARAQEVLLAVFHPLDGPRQVPREVGGEDGLGIRVDLTAEAAADIPPR